MEEVQPNATIIEPFIRIVENRLRTIVKRRIKGEQEIFRKGGETTYNFFPIRNIIEKKDDEL